MIDPRSADDARRARLLDAALLVFLRYGFRKASMDDIARAAQLSRQGLYLHFNSKEELLRATIEYALDSSLAAAHASLHDHAATLEARLVGAMDAWTGRYVGMVGVGAAELAEVSVLVEPLYASRESSFILALQTALTPLAATPHYQRLNVSAEQLALTLHATARGLKHSCATRAAFLDAITTAARILCAPL